MKRNGAGVRLIVLGGCVIAAGCGTLRRSLVRPVVHPLTTTNELMAVVAVTGAVPVVTGLVEGAVSAVPPLVAGSPETVASALPRWPDDAVEFGGRRYAAYDERVSWHVARQRCEALGGHLACVGSAEEQAFIAGLADGRYLFLGATDEAAENAWRWVTGEPFAYEAWMSGQPNNWGGDEHYLATYDGGDWVDVAVEGEEYWMPTGFICEWPAPDDAGQAPAATPASTAR